MRETDLFQLALGLPSPWEVQSTTFDPQARRLDITLHLACGSSFSCPDCGQAGLKAFDTTKKIWRHLNFFQHEAYLIAKVPRVKCEQCGVRLVKTPWAKAGSGFTLGSPALR